MSVSPEPTIRSERVYDGRVINLRIDTVELPGCRVGRREIVEHRGAACLVAIDSDENVLLVQQYRKAVDEVMLEVPAGTMDAEEVPEACARRELQEETGFAATHLEHLGTFYTTPGFTSEVMHAYLATGLIPSPLSPDEDEAIERVSVPFLKAIEMVRRGDIHDAKTIIALLMARGRR